MLAREVRDTAEEGCVVYRRFRCTIGRGSVAFGWSKRSGGRGSFSLVMSVVVDGAVLMVMMVMVRSNRITNHADWSTALIVEVAVMVMTVSYQQWSNKGTIMTY